MTEDGTKVNGEKLRLEQRNTKLKNIALVIGATATLVAAGTSLFSSLGLDSLIASKHTAQTETSKNAYDAMKTSNTKLREALRHAFERIRALESQVRDLKQDHKITWMMRMAAATHTPVPLPPPEPEVAPPVTSDVEALLGDVKPGWTLSSLLGKPKDEGLEMLEDAKPLAWDQVQHPQE